MSKAHFLWVDDEIDLLKPHILFLEEKGYETECASNGRDAIEMCQKRAYDIIFLDEQMPGLSGLETLTKLHEFLGDVPVVMITKSEDEGIMNRAIGRKITDYLIKPVNPSQVLMTVKKIIDKKQLVSETVTVNYGEAFGQLGVDMSNCRSTDDWKNVYRRLVYWELELERTKNPMKEMPVAQKAEANISFAKFIRKNYKSWVSTKSPGCEKESDSPVMSPDLFKTFVFPILDAGEKLFFILIDNFRLDQWEMVKDIIHEYYEYKEDIYFSILPTATPYSRNSLFSGLMPEQLSELYPDMWLDETEEDGKNEMEEKLIQMHLLRAGKSGSFSYYKINNNREGERLIESFSGLEKKDLNVTVFNFIDMLSHARTESKMLRELVADEAAYRSLTRSWFLHSPLDGFLKRIAQNGYKAIITSDHGSIRVKNGVKVVGDKQTSRNLRYKLGKNLAYDPKKVFEIIHPGNYGLPSPNMSTRYIFAQNRDFFVYPNNYNHFFSLYENTFQHGGISMEEIMIPCVTLTPR